MRRTGTWLCLAALLVAGAAAAPSALAAEYELAGLPEFGRCVPAATPHTGEYAGKNCLSRASGGKGKYNWEPGPGPKPKFEGAISLTKLETVGKKFTVQCSFGVATGEYKTPKTASVSLELVGCIRSDTGQKCQTNPGEEAEIEGKFEGELGFIKGGSRPKVGLSLKTPSPVVFSCGLPPEVPTVVTVEGAAIGTVKGIDAMREVLKLSYVAPGGKQSPEKFEGGPKETLTLKALTGLETTTEQVGLTIVGIEEKPTPLVIENEERIEVKAK
jgi:hypothetical protein